MKVESDAPECYNLLTNGEDYRGEQNKVYNGDGTTTPCLNWSESNDERYKSLDGNYCRNPGGTLLGRSTLPNEPWCFTKTKTQTNTKTPCGINKCNYKTIQKEGIIEMRKKAGNDKSWKPLCVNNINSTKLKQNLTNLVCKNIGYGGGTFQETDKTKEYAYEHKPLKKWIPASSPKGLSSFILGTMCNSTTCSPNLNLGWTPRKDANGYQYFSYKDEQGKIINKPYCPYFRTEDQLNPEKMDNTINKAKKYCNTRSECGGFDVYERDEYSGKDTSKFPHICFWKAQSKNQTFNPIDEKRSDCYIKQDKNLSGMETIYREYYPKKEKIFDIEESQKEFWPGYTKTIDIPDNSNWGIKIRLVNLVSNNEDIEFKLYGIAKDPTVNSNKLIAYTEDLEEYNYWRNLKYEKGHIKEGELKFDDLVWKKNKSGWNKLSSDKNNIGENICSYLDRNKPTKDMIEQNFTTPDYKLRKASNKSWNCGKTSLHVCKQFGKYNYNDMKTVKKENGHKDVFRGKCNENLLGWKPYTDTWQKSQTAHGYADSPYFPKHADTSEKIMNETIQLAKKFCDRSGDDCVGFVAYTDPTSTSRTIRKNTHVVQNYPWITFHKTWKKPSHSINTTGSKADGCWENKWGTDYVKIKNRGNGINYIEMSNNKITNKPTIEDILERNKPYKKNIINCGTPKNSYYFNNNDDSPKCTDPHDIKKCVLAHSSKTANAACQSKSSPGGGYESGMYKNGMYIKCTGPETLYDNTERTICSGKKGEKCLFTCKNGLKSKINTSQSNSSTGTITCQNTNKFDKGKCTGVQCTTNFLETIGGATGLICSHTTGTLGNNTKVDHGTECKLVCDDNHYVSGGENKFICNNSEMNNTSVNCSPKICSDIDMSDSSLKAYKFNGTKYTDKYILDKANFKIPVTCAENYKGKAIATPCINHQEPWTLSGCTKVECKSREKNAEDVKKMKEDIEKRNKRRLSELQEIFFKLGINNHKVSVNINKKASQLNSLVSKRNCSRDESRFKGNEGIKKFIRPWKSKLLDNFDIDLLDIECDKNEYTYINATEEDKQRGVTTETKILRQKNVDERNVLRLYKELKQYEKAKEELINRVFTNTKDIKLKNRYNEIKDEIKIKEEDMYNQSDGYTIYSENDLNINSLDVKVECTKYYKGVATFETCDKKQSSYKLKGCKLDLKHPHNCIDKCKKKDIESGKCKSSMIDQKYGDTVGDCGSVLIQGKTCSPKCKPGYFLERKTKCELKDDKGVIIPAKCKLFKKKEQKPDKPRIYKSNQYTSKEYQDKREQNMKQANNIGLQKRKQP